MQLIFVFFFNPATCNSLLIIFSTQWFYLDVWIILLLSNFYAFYVFFLALSLLEKG